MSAGAVGYHREGKGMMPVNPLSMIGLMLTPAKFARHLLLHPVEPVAARRDGARDQDRHGRVVASSWSIPSSSASFGSSCEPGSG